MGSRAGRRQPREVEAALFLVRSSPRPYPLSDEELRERVVAALDLGAQSAASLRRQWPQAPAETVAREVGLRVAEMDSSDQGSGPARIRLAEFLPGRGITLYQDGVAQVAAVLRRTLPEASNAEARARELLVAHELFHGLLLLPRGERPGPLDRSSRAIGRQLGYPARFLGIPFRAAIPELEEVAAHGFSTAWASPPVPALLIHARVAARYDPRWAECLAAHPEPAPDGDGRPGTAVAWNEE